MALTLVQREGVRGLALEGERFALLAFRRARAPRPWLRPGVLAPLLLAVIGLEVCVFCVRADIDLITSRADATILDMEMVNYRLELGWIRRGVPGDLEEIYRGTAWPEDAWGRPLLYMPTPGGPHGEWDLVSFGRDGAIGGSGPDADLYWSRQ